jgi:hypothetical protein
VRGALGRVEGGFVRCGNRNLAETGQLLHAIAAPRLLVLLPAIQRLGSFLSILVLVLVLVLVRRRRLGEELTENH